MNPTQTHRMLKTYLAVFGALAVLTLLTVAVSYLHLARPGAIVIAAVIAAVKASLIALFFMHLKFEGRLIYSFLFAALALVLVLILPVIIDIGF